MNKDDIEAAAACSLGIGCVPDRYGDQDSVHGLDAQLWEAVSVARRSLHQTAVDLTPPSISALISGPTPLASPPDQPWQRPVQQGGGYCSQHYCTWWIVFLIGCAALLVVLFAAKWGLSRSARPRQIGLRPFAGIAFGRQRVQPMQPVPIRKPLPEEGDSIQECLVCLEEVKMSAGWVWFPCKHGTCTSCYDKLLIESPFCPLCRTPLLEPKQAEGWEHVSLDGSIPRVSSQATSTRPSQSPPSEVSASTDRIVVVQLADDLQTEPDASCYENTERPDIDDHKDAEGVGAGEETTEYRGVTLGHVVTIDPEVQSVGARRPTSI